MKKETYKYQRIRDIREDNELAQQYVADYLDLYLTTYRRYETGEQTIPVNRLKNLQNYLIFQWII